ncbi:MULTISPECIES: acyl-protein synthetase [unclassified Micromonospora]|uniref:LuxE/PaaK family acyltransferase n=1 Tax=unclassified Micromonospora TaxID=2617518 RepID=UPI000EF45461|nr:MULTISPECIES: acyl-protein synthetase [unclassified Micromonospora]RLP87495.1 acyl-protein synthetase [Micromonospora sp. BL4]RLP95538.1 acyl-protein synthetase [Micromonospora sp. CV4]
MLTDVFTRTQPEKEERLRGELVELLGHHRRHCPPYARILDALDQDGEPATLADLPWLPVRLFKTRKLSSVPDDEVIRVLTSSGTTGEVSRIHLDRAAAATQSRMLARTLGTVLGPRRLPMIVVDRSGVVGDRRSYSARGAGALGMVNFGRDHLWLLDADDRPDVAALKEFLGRHGDSPFLVFGFTFMVWRYLYEVARDHGLDLSQGILVHSGGWKKLVDQAVDNAEFRRRLGADTGLTRIHNFYGMVEQIGTVFLEGPEGGSLYCPDFADVIVRDPVTWREAPIGTPGVIEVLSTLPTSYPGNVLLTEDLGVVHGVDDGHWPGKRFSVLGRLPRAEARGCSDTYVGGRS